MEIDPYCMSGNHRSGSFLHIIAVVRISLFKLTDSSDSMMSCDVKEYFARQRKN